MFKSPRNFNNKQNKLKMKLTDDQIDQLNEYFEDEKNYQYTKEIAYSGFCLESAIHHLHFHTYLGIDTINERFADIQDEAANALSNIYYRGK